MGKVMAQHSNLDTMVRENLREKILNGDLDGGYHLSELKISKEYNVSRTPVREALCALAADGLVEMVPHRGAFVTHVPSSTKVDQLQSYGLFLGLAAKLAAEKASIEALMDLEAAFAFTTQEDISTEAYLTAAETALEMVERTAASPTVSEAITMVKRRTNMAEIWASSMSQRKEVNNQFLTLLAALKRKKGDAAEKTLRTLATVAINSWMTARKVQLTSTDEVDDAPTYSRTRAVQKTINA
ncbi:MAG: GntR family transcriptional regulator [Proteobacteria bacterium]|nr:GntR family transcriptional regulator [Pseudomonadota bacterium]